MQRRFTENWLRSHGSKSGLYWDKNTPRLGVFVWQDRLQKSFIYQEPNGKRRTIGRVGKMTYKQAQSIARAKAIGETPEALTIQAAHEAWVRSILATGRSPRTVETRTLQLHKHASHLLKAEPSTITGVALASLRDELGKLSIYVANDVVSHLVYLVKTATNNEPTVRLFPRPDGKTRLQIDCLATWWATVQARSKERAEAFAFSMFTGLRRDEILAVRRSDIHGEWLWVRNPKGGTRRAFWRHLPRQARAIIDAQPGSDQVFPFSGLRLNDVAGTHAVRKVFATVLENELNAHRKITRYLLNHTAPRDVTDHYVGADWGELAGWSQKAADAMADKAKYDCKSYD